MLNFITRVSWINQITIARISDDNWFRGFIGACIINEDHFQPAPQPASAPFDHFADFSSSDPAQAFAETLHDFDLTIQQEKRRRRPRTTSFVPPLEETEAFELPPVAYDPVPPVVTEPDFTNPLSAEQNFFTPRPEQVTQNRRFAPANNDLLEPENTLYDWTAPLQNARPKEAPQPAKKSRKWVGFSLILLLGALGAGGYWLYDFYGLKIGEPVLIKALPDPVKVKPDTNAQQQAADQDMAVYNQDSSNPPPSSQQALLDGSEPPVNLDQLTPPPAIGEEGSAPSTAPSHLNQTDLDPVDASILAATERAVPVHIVPTVEVERDEQGNSDVPFRQEDDEVFVPAGDYRDQILRQIEQSENQTSDNSSNTNDPIVADAVSASQSVESTAPIETEAETVPLPATDSQEARPQVVAPPADNTAPDNADMSVAVLNPPIAIPIKPAASDVPANTASAAPAQPQTGAQTEIVSTERLVDERFYVQISSQPSRDAAIESADEAKRRFASLIGDNQVVIVPADIPGRGIYYRVRILVAENSEALTLCERYQAAGGNCFVGR